MHTAGVLKHAHSRFHDRRPSNGSATTHKYKRSPSRKRRCERGREEVSALAQVSQPEKHPRRTSGRAREQTVALLRAGREATDWVAILGLETKAEVMLAIAIGASRLLETRWRSGQRRGIRIRVDVGTGMPSW